MYIGDTEKTIRDIFLQAKRRSPSVIFFDEIESISSTRFFFFLKFILYF